jgi:hypothetical protein
MRYVGKSNAIPRVTTLPTTGNYESRTVDLQVPGSGGTGYWRMVYKDTGDTYRWIFTGGPNAFVGSSGGGLLGTPPSPVYTTWSKFPTNRGPQWTVPFTGAWNLSGGLDIAATANIDTRIIFSAGANAILFGHQGWLSVGINPWTNLQSGTVPVYSGADVILTAGQLVTFAYLTSTTVADQITVCQLHGQFNFHPYRLSS